MSKKVKKKKSHKITTQQLLLNDLHTVFRLKLIPEENDRMQSLILGFMRYNGWTEKQEWLVKSLIEKSIKVEGGRSDRK